VVIVVDSVGDEEEEISTSEYRTPLIYEEDYYPTTALGVVYKD